MAMVTKEMFMRFVDAGENLAEVLKKQIQKGGIITNEVVLALNEYIIASNEIRDLKDNLNETDESLN